MRNTFYSEKAQQVLSSFLKLSKNHADKYKLVKLMYLFEREMLIRTGLPSLSGRLCSIPLGPIISEVNDCIELANVDNYFDEDSDWHRNFSLDGNRVSLVSSDFSNDLLSEFEDELIYELFNKFKNYTFRKMKDYMHSLPEHVETCSCVDIPYADFFIKNGFDKGQIEEILQGIRLHLALTEANKEYA